MRLIEFALIVLAVVLAVRVFLFLKRRTSLLLSVLSIRKIDGAVLEIRNIFAFFCPKITKLPPLRVKLNTKTYAVWFYNGRGKSHAVHIVDGSFSSVFLKAGGGAKAKRFVRTLRLVEEPVRVYFPRTVFLPDVSAVGDEIPVLVFNPAPRELTYVSEERTSIKAAFTGDTIFGMRVFTKSTFINFIDRDSRGFFD